jgi:tetratricopeptide (TPR) repeat protein
MDDSRTALDADRKRQKLEAERERQHIAAERRTNRRFRIAFVVSFVLLLLSTVSGFMLNNQYITSQRNAEEAEHNLDLALNQTRKMTLAVQEALRQGSVSVTAAKDILTSAEDHELRVTMATPKGKSVQALVFILTSEVEATLGYQSTALLLAKKAVALAEELVADKPNRDNRKLLLDSLVKVGNAELTTGQVQASLDDLTRARNIARELKDTSQSDGQSLYGLVSVEMWRSEALRLLGRYAEARDVLDGALAYAEQCAKIDGANLQWRISPAVIHTKVGIAWAEQREPHDDAAQKDRQRHARENFDKAIKWQQALRISVDDILSNGDIVKYNLAKSYIAKADLLATLGQYKIATPNDLGDEDGNVAIPIYKRAIGILERLFDKDPANVNWLIELAAVSGKYGSALQKVNDLKGALAQYVSETFYYKKIIAKNDTNAEWNAHLLKSEGLVSELRKQLGDPDVPQDANETGKPK